MEHAKKYVLVSEARLHKDVEDQLGKLDKDMSAILKRKELADDSKAQLYLQVLQKYLHVIKKSDPRISVTEEEPSQDLKNEEEEPSIQHETPLLSGKKQRTEKPIPKSHIVLRKRKNVPESNNSHSGRILRMHRASSRDNHPLQNILKEIHPLTWFIL